jgi:hypothetical protein
MEPNEQYSHVREVSGQGWCGIFRLMFTTGLFVGLEEFGFQRRYCFETESEAVRALANWTGEGDPPGLWIKEKPSERRGPGNPEELVAAGEDV